MKKNRMKQQQPASETDKFVEEVVKDFLNEKYKDCNNYNPYKLLESLAGIFIGTLTGSIIAYLSNKSNLKTRVDSLERRVDSLENSLKEEEKMRKVKKLQIEVTNLNKDVAQMKQAGLISLGSTAGLFLIGGITSLVNSFVPSSRGNKRELEEIKDCITEMHEDLICLSAASVFSDESEDEEDEEEDDTSGTEGETVEDSPRKKIIIPETVSEKMKLFVNDLSRLNTEDHKLSKDVLRYLIEQDFGEEKSKKISFTHVEPSFMGGDFICGEVISFKIIFESKSYLITIDNDSISCEI